MLWCAGIVVFSGAARAETFGANGAFDAITVYAAQGVDHNLRQMPKLIMGESDWKWEHSRFAGVGFSKDRGTLGQSIEKLQGTPFSGMHHGYEVILLKHWGRQTNGEVGAAYMLRTPDANLGPISVNAAAGLGMSYALGRPTYEDGPDDDPKRRYRLQGLALFEAEWKIKDVQNLSLTTRIHHRCGFYGVIAPPHVGSNFIALGVRYKF